MLAIALVAALAVPAAAHAAGLDETCQLTATRFDPDTVNVLYPDSSAQYWSASYTAVPGTRIRIDGVYPYARYTSWNVYDPILRPFAKLSDYQIAPDPGSANPFLPGASRTTPAARRHYTLFITFSPNDHPGPNTIYVDPSQHPSGVFTLRVYVPDRGRDVTGGVGNPQVTWEPTQPEPTTAAPLPLPVASPASPCAGLQKPSESLVTGAYAGQEGPIPGGPLPGRNPPDWHKFTNLCQSGADLLLGNAIGDQVPQSGPNPCGEFGTGGFLSNLDNAYVYSFISRGFGPIVVLHGRAPTFAATYPNARVMPRGVQLRYFSFCQNDPVSERYVACRRDDQIKRRARRLHDRDLRAERVAGGGAAALPRHHQLDPVGTAAPGRRAVSPDAGLVPAGDPERHLRLGEEADGRVLPGGAVLRGVARGGAGVLLVKRLLARRRARRAPAHPLRDRRADAPAAPAAADPNPHRSLAWRRTRARPPRRIRSTGRAVVPHNRFMAANGVSEIHDDGWQTDAYTWAGPLGRSPQTKSS